MSGADGKCILLHRPEVHLLVGAPIDAVPWLGSPLGSHGRSIDHPHIPGILLMPCEEGVDLTPGVEGRGL